MVASGVQWFSWAQWCSVVPCLWDPVGESITWVTKSSRVRHKINRVTNSLLELTQEQLNRPHWSIIVRRAVGSYFGYEKRHLSPTIWDEIFVSLLSDIKKCYFNMMSINWSDFAVWSFDATSANQCHDFLPSHFLHSYIHFSQILTRLHSMSKIQKTARISADPISKYRRWNVHLSEAFPEKL